MAAKDSVRAAVDEWIKRDQADNRTVGEVRRIMEREVMPAWGDRALASIRKRDVIEPDRRHRRPRRQDRRESDAGLRPAVLQLVRLHAT